MFFKNRQAGKRDLKWRAGYRIVHKECNEHYLHVDNQATGKNRPYNVIDVYTNHQLSCGMLAQCLAELECL